MNILADRHHSGLANSLQLLFENRLGHNLFFQIGMEWYENGFWNVYPSIDTAKQYLEIGSQPKDKTPPLTISLGSCPPPLKIWDSHHKKQQKVITYEQFKLLPIDIVIASIPQHVKPFKELAKMKGAKFIFQMGNVFSEVNLNEIPNLLANTLPKNIPASTHYVSYHQEIDPVFKPSSVSPERLVTSFINVYQDNGGFSDFMSLKAAMPSHEFKSYGGQCMDGTITGVEQMAAIMNKSMFGFHSKYMGDGFGHVLYSWLACGRPVITRVSDYKGKLGEELLTHGETCLDLDVCSISEVSDIIMNMKPLHYVMMCQNARNRFDECVDYEAEELKIREFLGGLNG